MAAGVPLVALNSGSAMPVMGFGTASTGQIPADQKTSVFLDAIEVGYRHFDSASLYNTEKPLGAAVAEAVRRGTIRSREEVFVTSKLWCADADPQLVLPAIKESLANLGMDYLDLYLIHWPVRMKKKKKEEFSFPFHKDDILPFDVRGTWAAMEECQRLGLAKSIGVSNFSCRKLSELLANATTPPAVNQVEMNPVWNQTKLRNFCKERGIHITAFSPLGANGAEWGTPAVMESPVIKDIALAKGKSVAQICLRWLHEREAGMVVKSYNKERMRQNLQIFDWELNEVDNHKISQIPQKRSCRGEMFLFPTGPIKTVEELWDGEI